MIILRDVALFPPDFIYALDNGEFVDDIFELHRLTVGYPDAIGCCPVLHIIDVVNEVDSDVRVFGQYCLNLVDRVAAAAVYDRQHNEFGPGQEDLGTAKSVKIQEAEKGGENGRYYIAGPD